MTSVEESMSGFEFIKKRAEIKDYFEIIFANFTSFMRRYDGVSISHDQLVFSIRRSGVNHVMATATYRMIAIHT